MAEDILFVSFDYVVVISPSGFFPLIPLAQESGFRSMLALALLCAVSESAVMVRT